MKFLDINSFIDHEIENRMPGSNVTAPVWNNTINRLRSQFRSVGEVVEDLAVDVAYVNAATLAANTAADLVHSKLNLIDQKLAELGPGHSVAYIMPEYYGAKGDGVIIDGVSATVEPGHEHTTLISVGADFSGVRAGAKVYLKCKIFGVVTDVTNATTLVCSGADFSTLNPGDTVLLLGVRRVITSISGLDTLVFTGTSFDSSFKTSSPWI